jgi:YEATS domain-containing protein 4
LVCKALEEPPYEVCETGWGEFEILISLYLHDFPEKPIKVSHMLRLFPPEDFSTVVQDPTRPGILVAERFDEVVINEPTESFYDQVIQHLNKAYPLAGPVWSM